MITYGCQVSLCFNGDMYLTSDQLNESLRAQKLDFINFEKCVFILVPVLNNVWVSKLVDLVRNNMDVLANKDSTFKSRQQTIKTYEQNLDEEMVANVSCFQKLQDTIMNFSTSAFHLVHKDSLKFLTISAKKIELLDFPTEESLLQFQPIFQYQKQIVGIQDQETVTLCGAHAIQNRRFYLCASDDHLYISQEPSLLRLNLYSPIQDDDELLFVGDIIALNLSETNLFLNAKQPYDTFHQILNYRIYQITKEQQTTTTLTQITFQDLQVNFDDVIERVGMKRIQKLQASSYWKIEKTNGHGGQVQFNQLVRLRHNQSNLYLAILNSKPILTHQLTKESLFLLVPIEENLRILKKDSYFKIKHFHTGIYLEDLNKFEGQHKLVRLRKIGENEDQDNKMLQYAVPEMIQAIELLEQIQLTEFIDRKKEINLKIQFYQIYKKIKKILQYVQQFLMNKLITHLSTTQKYDQLSFIRQDQFKQEPLFPLICLLFQMIMPQELEKEDLEDPDYKEKQEQCYNSFEIDEDQVLKYFEYQLQDLQNELIYSLQVICKDNLENQNSLFQFLPILHEHIIKYKEFTSVLTNLISKNFQFLEEFSKIRIAGKNTLLLVWLIQRIPRSENELIKTQRQEVDRQKAADILYLLAHSCSFGVQAVFANQEIIFKTLMQQKPTPLLKCQVDQEKNILVECTSKQEGIYQKKIEEFFGDQHRKNNPHFTEELNLLRAQFFLFSQLCIQRNYYCCKYFSEQFSDNSLVPLLSNQIIDIELRAHLLSLCKNIYLDRDPLVAQVKPNLVRMRETNKSQDFFYDDDEDEQQEKLELENDQIIYIQGRFKQMLSTYLKQIVEVENKQKVYNKLTLEVTRILFMLLQFGLFQNQDDQKEQELFLEKLIVQLSVLLEYDYDQQPQQKNKLLDLKKMAKMIPLSKLLFRKQQQINKNQNKLTLETLRDPLLRKLQNVKRVLSKFHNKTCLVSTPPNEYEVAIKIEICKIFQYLLDLRLDYMLENTMIFFQYSFVPYIQHNKPILEKCNKRFNKSFIALFKEDLLRPGQRIPRQSLKEWSQENRIRHFDRIVERPFVEILFKAFYAANDHQLQNNLVLLIERFQGQRFEYFQYLTQVQLIITTHLQAIYRTMFIFTQRLKNNVENSQIWLRLDIEMKLNSKNEEIIEKVLDRLGEMYNMLNKFEGNQKTIRKVFLNCGGFAIIQHLVIKCLALIDENIELFECGFECQEYDEKIQYQQELAEKILQIFKACLKLIDCGIRNDQSLCEYILQRLARPLLRYNMVNLGQIEFINELCSNNHSLLALLNSNDLCMLLEYVKLYGKYPQFIQLFSLIVKNKQSESLYKDIYLAFTQYDPEHINPFQDNYTFEKFYQEQAQIEEYRQLFLKIAEALLIHDDRGMISLKMLEVLDFTDLIKYLLEKTQEMRNTNLDLSLQESITIIKHAVCRIALIISKRKKKLLLQHEHYLLQIITIEAIWLEQQESLQSTARQYIVETLLPIINTFNEYKQKKSSFNIEIPQIRNYALSIQKQYSSLIKINDTQAQYQAHRLIKAFDLKIPDEQSETDESETELHLEAETFKSDRFIYYQVTEDSDTSEQGCNDLEMWEFFKKCIETNNKIKQLLNTDTLAQSIWQVSDMFTNDYWLDKQKKQLILTSDDLLQKLLVFLQFWKSNKASKQSAIFAVKLLEQVLTEDQNRIKVIDQLGGTKIILTLIWEESESENDYLIQLLQLLRNLLNSKQVQKTILSFLNSAISSDKFFQKMDMLMGDDKKLCSLVLEILDLMCANNNLELQNLIRYQKNNKKSYDLVQQTINVLCSYDVSNHFEFIILALKSLKSQINACHTNQVLLTNSKFVEFVVRLLNGALPIGNLNEDQITILKHQSLIILLVTSEMNTKEDYIIVKLKKIVPKTILIQHFVSVYSQMISLFGEDNYSKEIFLQQPNFILQSGFNAYILWVILSDTQNLVEDTEEFKVEGEEQLVQYFWKDNILDELTRLGQSLMEHGLEQLNQLKQQLSGDVQEKIILIQRHELMHKAMLFYKNNTLQVEFVKDENLYTTYFVKLPCFDLLKSEIKSKFLEQADRTSTQTKIYSLLNFVDSAYKNMLHQETLRDFFKNHKILQILVHRGKLWMQLAFYNGLLINVIIILSYTQMAFPPKADPNYDTIQYYRLNEPRFLDDYQSTSTLSYILLLAELNLFINFMVLFFYLVDKAPVKLQFVWNAWHAKSVLGHLISGLIKIIISIFVLIIDFDIIYYILQIVFNVIGIVIHPFFLAFHTIHILSLEPLIPILKAVWLAKWKFIGLWLLIALLEYWASLISYVYFFEFFVDNNDVNLCSRLWQCGFVVFDWTFKTDGSVGGHFMESIGVQAENDYLSVPSQYFGRFFYDNIINIVIKLFFINILLAVILNSYSELRYVQKQQLHDQNHKCFICGIDRLVFDKINFGQNAGFWNHIRQEHNVWNYLFYICYLRISNQGNGVDIFIQTKQICNDVSWFPIKRAKALSQKSQLLEVMINTNKQSKIKLNKLNYLIRKIIQLSKKNE